MGSSTSKSINPEASATPFGRRSYSRNVFQTSCIRPASGPSDSSDIDDDEDIDTEQVAKENVINGNRSNITTSKSKGKTDRNKNIKKKSTDKRAFTPPEAQQVTEWGESSLSNTVSINTSDSSSSRNPSSRFLSRFTFFPGNTSSRSSRAYPESSTSSIISNDEDLHSNHSINRTKTRVGCEPFPSCFMPRSHQPQDNDSDSDNSDLSSIHELSTDPNSNRNNNGSLFSPRNGSRYGGNNRRMESREPVEQNVRFSRTLSVGRLRDRVVNRPTFPELSSFQFQQESEVSEGTETGSLMISTTSSYASSNISNSLFGNQDFEDSNLGARETRYSNLLEHRPNFLERRRRIRSQVHALQRMGNRFENLSGHERSCILSGQYQTGHCSCRLNNQDQNDGNNNNTRGSISRIVLLAEALFEVLDEIHQQSVVSSSSHALSSIGSIPAPSEAVEALPVKLYHKFPKNSNEDDAQCYICLVEYEDGDEVRVLPCHHEFHRLCIDKWLKEIHRICPLCRGDICKTGSLPTEGLKP